MDVIGKQIKDIQKWQVEIMGNTCSVCHGDNTLSRCSACKFWGKVCPLEWEHSKFNRYKSDTSL